MYNLNLLDESVIDSAKRSMRRIYPEVIADDMYDKRGHAI